MILHEAFSQITSSLTLNCSSTMMWVTKHNNCCSSSVLSMGLIATVTFSLLLPPALVNGFVGHIPAGLGRTTAAIWITSSGVSGTGGLYLSQSSKDNHSFSSYKVSSVPDLDQTSFNLSNAPPSLPDIIYYEPSCYLCICILIEQTAVPTRVPLYRSENDPCRP
jgi:hypothetical protein